MNRCCCLLYTSDPARLACNRAGAHRAEHPGNHRPDRIDACSSRHCARPCANCKATARNAGLKRIHLPRDADAVPRARVSPKIANGIAFEPMASWHPKRRRRRSAFANIFSVLPRLNSFQFSCCCKTTNRVNALKLAYLSCWWLDYCHTIGFLRRGDPFAPSVNLRARTSAAMPALFGR